MIAHCTVVAERRGPRTRCTTLRCAPPLTLRNAGDGLYLVGTAAGPIGGDHSRIDLEVGDGAEMIVRSAAAQVLLPGPTSSPSDMTVSAAIGRDAVLRWMPEPVIAVRGADHRCVTYLEVAAGATVVWREEIVLGRHGEPSGSVLSQLRVVRDGSPLLRQELALGPRWPWASSPAGAGTARFSGTALIIGPAAVRLLTCSAETESAVGIVNRDGKPSRRRLPGLHSVAVVDGVRAAGLQLAPDAVLVTALSQRRQPLHQLLVSLSAGPTDMSWREGKETLASECG